MPGESHGQKSLADHSPSSYKELDTTEVTSQAGTSIWSQLMTKEPRIYNGERIVPSIDGVGKTGQPQAKERK